MQGQQADRARFGWRRSVFWKVAGVLVGAQAVVALLAVGLSAWFAYARSLDLAANSLRLRLDGLAEEVEQRAGSSVDSLEGWPLPLRLDLAARFPDPVTVLSAAGDTVRTIAPDPQAFAQEVTTQRPSVLPPDLQAALEEGGVLVQLDEDAPAGTWGLAPLYTPDGFLAGGLLVQPLSASLARELAGTRQAFWRALRWTLGLAGLIALVLGALFTWRLVRPLRRVTRHVERVGAGRYEARLPVRRRDEFGRLAEAANRMAAEVEQSVEALKATDRLRRELVANVGHDLRTPLAALLGYTEEAARHLGTGDQEAAREALATAARQGRYLRRLVEDLFELSLLEGGPAPLRREPIPLAELLSDAARAHRGAFEAAGIRFVLDRPAALPTLEGDGVRLLRVLDNLLSNARRHTPEGGIVRLEAEASDAEVKIRVCDTGPGLAPETLERVFERYYRGTGARTRGEEGTGLGLSISRAIARAHGGDLTARSTPGQGSTFTLRLPA